MAPSYSRFDTQCITPSVTVLYTALTLNSFQSSVVEATHINVDINNNNNKRTFIFSLEEVSLAMHAVGEASFSSECLPYRLIKKKSASTPWSFEC